MTKQTRKAKDNEILELNKQGLCQHRKPIEGSTCQDCHDIYIEMTIEAMGDDYIGQEL